MQAQTDLLHSLPGAERIGSQDQSELVCMLTAGLYGLSIKTVQEIIPLPPIMPLPQLPQSMMGVCRYREMIIPVINMPLLLEQSTEQPVTEEWQMIVIADGSRVCGMAVKDINEILSFSLTEMEPMPAVDAVQNEAFYRGIKRMGEDVVILLRVDAILEHCNIPQRSMVEHEVLEQQTHTERIGILQMGDVHAGVNIDLIERILPTPKVEECADLPAGVKGMALSPEALAEQATAADYYPVIDIFHFLQVPDEQGKRNLILSSRDGHRVGYYTGVVQEIKDIDTSTVYQLPQLAQTQENLFVSQVILLEDQIIQLLDLQAVGSDELNEFLQHVGSDDRANSPR